MRRVDEAMRTVLSDAIATDLKDPRVGFVTVTSVKTSPDLRHARVYVSVLGDDARRAETLDGLRSAHGYLQRRLAGELSLKHTPAITFEYDDSVDRGMRISELLDQVGDRQVGDRDPQAGHSDRQVGDRDPQAGHSDRAPQASQSDRRVVPGEPSDGA